MLEDYLKAVPDLTIYKPNKVAEQTQALMSQMESKSQEILELKEQMNKMQQVEQMNYKSYDDLVEEVYKKAKQHIEQKDQEIQTVCFLSVS